MVMTTVMDKNSPPAATTDGADRTAMVWEALRGVTDPEIPVLSILDLGIIADVRIDSEGVTVELTPTFAGCPALDMIRDDIKEAVAKLGDNRVTVNIVYDPPWTTDRITEAGRRTLKEFGLAPPGKRCEGGSSVPDLESVACPFCDSTDTELESLFGPTLCRSIHYCRGCLQSFEHFKAV